MFETNVYLRCEKDHANAVPMGERANRVGSPCSICGKPLQQEAPRERPAFRGGNRY
jgi:hypothetical protein